MFAYGYIPLSPSHLFQHMVHPYIHIDDFLHLLLLSIFGERERPNYSARQSVFHLRSCFLFIFCAHNRLVYCFHARETKRNLVYRSQEIESKLLLCMYGAQHRDRHVSLFGGLCGQTLPPSNYVYIELSARLDASPALGCLYTP